MDNVITLAGKQIEVQALNFKALRSKLPAINRLAAGFAVGHVDEAMMNDLADVLSAATGISVEDLDAMPIRVHELTAAFQRVVVVTGLVEQGGGSLGEA